MTDQRAIAKKLLQMTTRQRRKVFAYVMSLVGEGEDDRQEAKRTVTAQDD